MWSWAYPPDENDEATLHRAPYTRPVMRRRFVDNGRRLAGFSGEFLVRCPRCRAAAKVLRGWDHAGRAWTPATIGCAACGFSRRQTMPAGCECGRCRRPVSDSWAAASATTRHSECFRSLQAAPLAQTGQAPARSTTRHRASRTPTSALDLSGLKLAAAAPGHTRPTAIRSVRVRACGRPRRTRTRPAVGAAARPVRAATG